MRQYGLIGHPLSHSFSKGYFTDKFLREDIRDCHYKNFPLESIDDFPALLNDHPELCGLNVTIPYKEAILPYLDELDEDAARIGAVNTIRFTESGLTGFNTDVHGFQQSLQPLLPAQKIKALILGTGGASKAVTFVLDRLEIPYLLVSRTADAPGRLAYEALNKQIVQTHQLIINTTPLGMYPAVEAMPKIPYGAIGGEHILYDLVYNPSTTRFLESGQARGARIKNGLEMLEIQAEKAWAIWNDY
jgi:shikimate dehydrogenase